MIFFHRRLFFLSCFGSFFGCLLLFPFAVGAQKNSVVQVHADKVSGYGVAWGGPKNTPDLIVTSLHVVAGKSSIMVVWQGKTAAAQIEKIYKPSDLALLKLKTPLGVPPLTIYSGEPPWDTNINFWEIPVNSTTVSAKTTVLEERTSLAKISPRVANNAAGLSKSLCMDAGQFYPLMTTEVINFGEPNIRKAHSGSPLTYGDKILGIIDGGAKLVDGKPCVWAIPGGDFTKLFNQGTPATPSLQSCESAGTANKFMYSGTRSDNPMLTPEEAQHAREFESSASAPVSYPDASNDQLAIYDLLRMNFSEVFESLFDATRRDIKDLFDEESEFHKDQRLFPENLMDQTLDIHQEDITGVSLAIPTGSQLVLSRDEFGPLISVHSPSGIITLSIYISHNQTPEEAANDMVRFKEIMKRSGQQTEATADNKKDFTCDSKNSYYRESIENAVLSKSGELESEFFVNMTINESDFLAVTVSVSDWKIMWNNQDERLSFYLMEACAILADFAIN